MEIALVGTGISALLLAQSLIRQRCFRRLRVIGPRPSTRAHRLSYWSDGPTPFDGHVDASYSALTVTDASARAIPVALGRLAYRTFRAQRWVDDVAREIFAAPDVEYIEAHVDALEANGDAAIVHAGSTAVSADWVFSSDRSAARPDRHQRFLGWEIETEQPIDTRAATLLDFRTASGRDFRFMYQLPLAPRRLFVEHVSYEPCDHAAELRVYLEDVLGIRGYRLLDQEGGATPLFRDRPERAHGRVVAIGVGGGLAKATTGYAITRMWRDAEQIAASLLSRGRPHLDRRLPFLYRVADHFFLDLLARAPERLPGFMSTLFSRVTGDAVLSFLDDRARLREKLAVALSMPGWLRWWLSGRV